MNLSDMTSVKTGRGQYFNETAIINGVLKYYFNLVNSADINYDTIVNILKYINLKNYNIDINKKCIQLNDFLLYPLEIESPLAGKCEIPVLFLTSEIHVLNLFEIPVHGVYFKTNINDLFDNNAVTNFYNQIPIYIAELNLELFKKTILDAIIKNPLIMLDKIFSIVKNFSGTELVKTIQIAVLDYFNYLDNLNIKDTSYVDSYQTKVVKFMNTFFTNSIHNIDFNEDSIAIGALLFSLGNKTSNSDAYIKPLLNLISTRYIAYVSLHFSKFNTKAKNMYIYLLHRSNIDFKVFGSKRVNDKDFTFKEELLCIKENFKFINKAINTVTENTIYARNCLNADSDTEKVLKQKFYILSLLDNYQGKSLIQLSDVSCNVVKNYSSVSYLLYKNLLSTVNKSLEDIYNDILEDDVFNICNYNYIEDINAIPYVKGETSLLYKLPNSNHYNGVRIDITNIDFCDLEDFAYDVIVELLGLFETKKVSLLRPVDKMTTTLNSNTSFLVLSYLYSMQTNVSNYYNIINFNKAITDFKSMLKEDYIRFFDKNGDELGNAYEIVTESLDSLIPTMT